jgi:hypothetical protein
MIPTTTSHSIIGAYAIEPPALGDLVSRRHPALDRIGRDGAREHDDVD